MILRKTKHTDMGNPIIVENWSALPKDPLVSIRCITYNHEKFITDAIEGFLMQKTDFSVEILIHDDASTDHTADIIRKYQEKYPHLIRAVFQSENQYQQGKKPSRILQNMCRGKYSALCEGDDFWIDPSKLQKQVNFLEANPEFTLCAHDINIVDENGAFLQRGSENYLDRFNQEHVYDFDDIALGRFFYTCSMVIRNEPVYPLPEWTQQVYGGDYTTQLLAASKGRIKYFEDVMGCFRMVPTGLSATTDGTPQQIIKRYQQQKLFLNHFGKAYRPYYPLKIAKLTRHEANIYKINGQRVKAFLCLTKSNAYLFWFKLARKVKRKLIQ
jgi:glycosyltransferase involved in cell wall biosynthesis